MDSDNEDNIPAGFTGKGGEALNLDDDDDNFNDSEDVDDAEDDDEQEEDVRPSGKSDKEVKGKELEN